MFRWATAFVLVLEAIELSASLLFTGLIEPGRQIWAELPRVNRCAWRASQRPSATALFEPHKLPNGAPTLPAKWISLKHCFIAECVLTVSRSYFLAGAKRSTSSFQSAMILAFVFRAL
jgi:hypothetical protein